MQRAEPVAFPYIVRTPLFVCFFVGVGAAQVPPRVDFARDIRPILMGHCVECHGPTQQMRGLRLDRRRDALPNRVGANGACIVPGNAEKSSLYRRVSGTQAGVRMPPAGPLRPEQIDVVKAWIDQGAEWPDAWSGDRDETPADPAVLRMMTALRNANSEEFRRVVAGSPKSVNAKGHGGWTPIMYAALYSGEAVGLLLEKGADPNAQNDDGGTALMYAIDDAAKLKRLLDAGANPNLRSGEGRTALEIVNGLAGSAPVLKLLLDKGADAKSLTLVASAHDPSLLRVLLDHGAARKPLPLGQAVDCAACFDLLYPLAEPADLNRALQGAVRFGNLSRLRMLLERGAQASPNLLESVALATAAIPAEDIKTLISRGANISAKTSTGLSIMEFARRQGNTPLVEALTEGGVPEDSPAIPRMHPKAAGSLRAAIERTIPLLQRSDAAFFERGGCVSCHNNSLTAMTVASARAKGLRVNEQIAKDQLRKITAFLQENAERALENEGLPGRNDTVSYILLGLAAEKYPGDATIDVWARFVKNSQSPDGRFRRAAERPPLESSDFEVTAASIRALRTYGPKSLRAEFDRAAERGVHWLEQARPADTEDHAFQILGLVWGGGSQEAIRRAARDLLALQRYDGGWGQVPGLPSDAYATGQSLVALRESRAISANSAAYQQGIQYLLNSQLEDGSWYVRTRALAIQPYFDSGFPHGTDQFISAAASNWATMALITALR